MNIEISTPRLENDIRSLQENLERLSVAKDRVYQCLENLDSMWTGIAKEVFKTQVRTDAAVFLSLISNLNNMIDCMTYARTEYEKCNDEVESKIARIRLANDN